MKLQKQCVDVSKPSEHKLPYKDATMNEPINDILSAEMIIVDNMVVGSQKIEQLQHLTPAVYGAVWKSTLNNSLIEYDSLLKTCKMRHTQDGNRSSLMLNFRGLINEIEVVQIHIEDSLVQIEFVWNEKL
jgi:hypothetical protein